MADSLETEALENRASPREIEERIEPFRVRAETLQEMAARCGFDNAWRQIDLAMLPAFRGSDLWIVMKGLGEITARVRADIYASPLFAQLTAQQQGKA